MYLRQWLCSGEGRSPKSTRGRQRFSVGALGLRSCLGSARISPSRCVAGTSGLRGKRVTSQPGCLANSARGGCGSAGLTRSLRRRGRPHAPAAPPASHSISKITHTCAGKQARQPPRLRVLGEPEQRAPSSRTCRQAPPTGFCVARPRPARQAPPSPSLLGSGVLTPATLYRLTSPRFCKFLALMERGRPGPLPTSFPSSPHSPPLVLRPSARRRPRPGAPSLSLPSVLPILLDCLLFAGGGGEGEREGRLEPGD